MIHWSEVTAIFGGTFDPPHVGHREALEGIIRHPGVGRVLVIPSASPPHKPCQASAEDRAEMAHLCFRGLPVTIDLLEIDRAQATGKPSYSFDTIQDLRREIPDRQLAFVIGIDQLAKLHGWYRFPELLSLCHWLVLQRREQPESIVHEAMAAIAGWEGSGLMKKTSDGWQLRSGHVLSIVPTPARALSSTEIREEIARSGQPPENTLLPDVASYLKVKRLYGMNPSKSVN